MARLSSFSRAHIFMCYDSNMPQRRGLFVFGKYLETRITHHYIYTYIYFSTGEGKV